MVQYNTKPTNNTPPIKTKVYEYWLELMPHKRACLLFAFGSVSIKVCGKYGT